MPQPIFTQDRRVGALEELIPEAALAERWDVSIRTMQRRRASGDTPPFVQIGRSVFYRSSDVAAHEAARTVHRERQ